MTHLSRPRLWLAALLAALSLMVFVTPKTRRSDAQDTKAEEPSLEKTKATSAASPPIEKGSKKSQTQRNSTIVIQNNVVVLPKELIESQQVSVAPDGNLAIGWSQNRDLLFGYSVTLGKWVKQPIEVPRTTSEPRFGQWLGIVKLYPEDKPEKLTFFAFSSIGRWDSIEVSADASSPTIHLNTIVVTDGETTHVFRSDPGKWSSPTAVVTENEVRKPGDFGNSAGAQGGGGFGGGGPTTGGGLGGGGQAGGGGVAYQSSRSTIEFSDDVVALPKEAIGSDQIVSGGSLAIIASNKHDMLWGYSKPLGKWFKQPVSLDGAALIPIVGGAVAAVAPVYKTKPEKKTYFAFSAATGRWSSIDVSLNASEPSVHATMVVVTDGETTHVFKNNTGKWSTPTASVADDERSSATNPTPKSKHQNVATAEFASRSELSYAPPYLLYAPDLEVYLVDLDADGVLDVVPNDGTKSSRPGENHSIVGAWQMVRETAAKRREVAEEQAALQESLGPQHPALAKINTRLADLEDDERDWIARLKAFAAPASFGRVTVSDWQSRLKSELQQGEQEAERAARAVKSPKNSRDKDQAQARLRESVGKAFASRQQLQKLEAELLRERLRQVDDRLQERGRLRDRIIQRRVEELSNPNLDWGASKPLDVSKAFRPQPRTQDPQSSESVPLSDQPQLEEPIPVHDHDDGAIVLKYTIYEANETALKELGRVPKTNEKITGDNKLSRTTTVTATAKIAMLPELILRENLKLLTRGISVNKLNFPLPMLGVSKDATDGLELFAQPTVVKNGRVHLFAKMNQRSSLRPLVEDDSVVFKTDLLLNSTDPSLVGPFKIPGENNPWLIASFVAEVVVSRRPTPDRQSRTVAPDEPVSDAPNAKPESRAVRIGPPAEAVAIVNGEVISYRDLVVWGMSLKELDGAVNLILLKQAAKQAKLDISSQNIDAEVQQLASKFEVSIDQWYSMLEKERGISRDHYREFAIWPQLVLKRLAGDDPIQQLTFLAGLRAAAKIELVEPDAKLRPISTESTEPANNEAVPPTELPPAKKEQVPDLSEADSKP